MKDTDIAYIAGLVDGEGSICLQRKHKNDPYRRPVVSIPSTTRELVQRPKLLFGGCICKHKTYKEHHKQHWSWRLSDRAAVKFCAVIYPWLLEPSKQHRAKLIADTYLLVTPRNGKYSEIMHERKMRFEHEFLHLLAP